MKIIIKNKIAKGIASLTIIVILLLSVLAGSFYYQNNITANAVKEDSTNFNEDRSIKEIDVRNLNQLNEGWYKTINGNLFYLEDFDKPVFIYTRIVSAEHQNEMFSVDADGNVKFYENGKSINNNQQTQNKNNNGITGNVVGMGSVSGFVTYSSGISPILQLDYSSSGTLNIRYNANQQNGKMIGVEVSADDGKTWKSPNNNNFLVKNLANSLTSATDWNQVATISYNEVSNGYAKSLTLWANGNKQVVYYPSNNQKPSINNFISNPNFNSGLVLTTAPTAPVIPTSVPENMPILSENINTPVNTQLLNSLRTSFIDQSGNFYAITSDNKILYIPRDGSQLIVGTKDGSGKWNYVKTTDSMPSQPVTSGLPSLFTGSNPLSQLQPTTVPINLPQITTTISSYSTEIQSAYTRYPELNRYPGIIEQLIAAESSGVGSAVGDGGTSIGLMQINTGDPASMRGYTLDQLQNPTNNIDAGAQKIMDIINSPNFKGDRRQIIFGYNQGRVPTIEDINSGDPKQIYQSSSVDVATAQQLYSTRLQAAQLNQLTTLKSYEVLYQGKWQPLPGRYTSQQEADNAARGIGTTRPQTVAAPGTYIYNVFDNDKQFIGTVTANDIGSATSAGQMLARMQGKEFGQAEQPKFRVSNSLIGIEMKISANSLDDAKKIYADKWKVMPDTGVEIKPGTSGNTYTYNLIDGNTGQRIVTLTFDSEQEAKDTLEKYQSYDRYKNAKLEKVPTLDDLVKLNPGKPIAELQKELQNLLSNNQARTAELKEPVMDTINLPNGKKVYYIGNNRFENLDDAQAALQKAKIDFNLAVQSKYANDPKLLQGRAIISNERTPDGELLSQDKDGVYKFIPTKDETGKIIGGTWISVGKTYQRQITIGQGANAINIIETVDSKTRKVLSGFFKQGDKEIILDTYTLEQIKKGATNINIISSEKDKDQVIEFTNPKTGLISHITTNPSTGYREEQTIRNTYFDENGKPLSNSEVQQRLKDNNLPSPIRETLQSKSTENGQTYITNFNYRTENRNGENVRISDGTKINEQTGEFEGMVYSERDSSGDERRITLDKNGNILKREVVYRNGAVGSDSPNAELDKKAKTAITQRKSREFFSGFQFIFTEFRGLGYIPSIFGFDDDKLIEWRNGVDKTFQTLYLGTEYWQSKICTATSGLATDNEGIAYAETPQGLAQIGAHIEATRTQPIVTGNGTNFIYKITFQIRNGDYDKDQRAPENMSINVFIIPKDKQISDGIKIFKKDVNIGRGSAFGRFGTNAIVKESKSIYDKICIEFDKVPLKWKIKDNVLCNKIEISEGLPTVIQQRTTAQQGTNADMNNDW